MRYLCILALIVIGAVPQAPGDVVLPVCSAAVHAGYTAIGPDGLRYPTWHPQVDPIAHCHFDHEHGSSPALLLPVERNRAQPPSVLPVFGYTAAKAGMTEGHAGFKNYVFSEGAYRWMWTHHFGTSNHVAAACVRMHTVDVVGVDIRTLEVVVDIHTMVDFGDAASFVGQQPLVPAACPAQWQGLSATRGRRRIPVASEAPAYHEAWNSNSAPLKALGFSPGGMYVITDDPQTVCGDLACVANVTGPTYTGRPALGTLRTLRFGPYGPGFSVTGVISGTFYTDPTGQQLRTPDAPDAVRQYIKPGFSYAFPSGQPTCLPTPELFYWCTAIASANANFYQFNPFVTGAN